MLDKQLVFKGWSFCLTELPVVHRTACAVIVQVLIAWVINYFLQILFFLGEVCVNTYILKILNEIIQMLLYLLWTSNFSSLWVYM